MATTTDEVLRGLLPGWMLRTSRIHWKQLMKATFTVIDNTFEDMRLARLASMPGQINAGDLGGFESVDALPFIGRDRRLARGKLETDADYAARLRYWREAWRSAGTHAGLLYALRAVLTPSPPKIRLVRGGVTTAEAHWWTLDDTGLRYQQTSADGSHNGLFWAADGSAAVADTTAAHAWDWDSQYWVNPAANDDPARVWVIIEAPSNPPELEAIEGPFDDGLSVFGEAAADGDKYTIGTTATKSFVETVRTACAEFKSAGNRVDHICVAFDTPLWYPEATESAGNFPDGWWRYHGRIREDSGVYSRIRARSTFGRYWAGTV